MQGKIVTPNSGSWLTLGGRKRREEVGLGWDKPRAFILLCFLLKENLK